MTDTPAPEPKCAGCALYDEGRCQRLAVVRGLYGDDVFVTDCALFVPSSPPAGDPPKE